MYYAPIIFLAISLAAIVSVGLLISGFSLVQASASPLRSVVPEASTPPPPPPRKPAPTRPSDLIGKTWELKTIGGREVSRAETEDPVTLYLDDGGRINGSTGCNVLIGRYTLAESPKVRFSQLVTTTWACGDMGVERELLTALRAANEITVSSNGKTMSLHRPGRGVLATYALAA